MEIWEKYTETEIKRRELMHCGSYGEEKWIVGGGKEKQITSF